jgi:hypothetical protein
VLAKRPRPDPAAALAVPQVHAANLDLETWTPDECPLHRAGVELQYALDLC